MNIHGMNAVSFWSMVSGSSFFGINHNMDSRFLVYLVSWQGSIWSKVSGSRSVYFSGLGYTEDVRESLGQKYVDATSTTPGSGKSGRLLGHGSPGIGGAAWV